MAYNSSVQSSTRFTPFYLMFGREARLPVDLMYGSCPDEPQTPITYASQLQESLQQAYATVRESLHTAHNRQKDNYDQHVHGKPLQPGDLVWLHNMSVPLGRSRKLHCPWNGPHEIVEKLSDCTYKIRNLHGNQREQIVHFNRLKLCSPFTRARERQTPTTATSPTHGSAEIGEHIDFDLTDDDNLPSPPPSPSPVRRYPVRSRRPPDRLIDQMNL